MDATGTVREPDPVIRDLAHSAVAHEPVVLSPEQRTVVADTIRRWHLHAVHVGDLHVHVVVTADKPQDTALSEFKAWCSRRLNEGFGRKPK